MIYHYVLAYDFSTAQHIHHVPYLHLARRMREKIHASESGSESVSNRACKSRGETMRDFRLPEPFDYRSDILTLKFLSRKSSLCLKTS